MEQPDPLRGLLLDAAEVDRAMLAEVLADRIGIDGTSGRLVLLPVYAGLNARQKVLCVLLAARAAHLLELRDGDMMTTKEIVATSGLPHGTAAPRLKELREYRLVDQTPNKAYFIPNAFLQRVVEDLRRGA